MIDTQTPVTYEPMPKIPRLNRLCILTEKIDGTNAAVIVDELGNVFAASKNRVLTPDEPDNFGFRAWVEKNTEELRKLGPGTHRGEWWGKGIGKRHPNMERTFSLFNTSRWVTHGNPGEGQANVPACCSVVPVVAELETLDAREVNKYVSYLQVRGSYADPSCKNPEGVVVFHTKSGLIFKVTCEKDDEHKGVNRID